ncbi:TauD/TfdA family dioxygenase [uncultured Pigmentiphaga sp.]|uniref:TauD/TfdA family dioxygenase n=1 Tax=uncultured Pigmentiphaga sp. TaxID=340361 RepID=UPI0026157BAC|nr:TauD/TfdA family dioxygenase [uncultured Pigmentiphaga sp.]
MSAVYMHVITSRDAWIGAELAERLDWQISFTNEEVEEIDRALRAARDRNLALLQIDRDTFPLPTVARKLASCAQEVERGLGVVVLSGLPIERYPDDEAGMVFWGLGAYLGLPVMQNPRGELLGHVKDYGRQFGQINVRGYETNAHLPFHTDGCDEVGLMCLRRAKAGGASSVVSAATLHNELLRRYPEYLPPLYRGFHYIRREAALTEAGVTPHRVPVFGQIDGLVSCRYIRAQIEAGAKRIGQPLTSLEIEALDCFDELARDPKLHLDMELQPGDIQLCNNYTVLHSRTDFEDWPEPGRERHLLRLWLTCRERRPLPPDFPQLNGYGLARLPS